MKLPGRVVQSLQGPPTLRRLVSAPKALHQQVQQSGRMGSRVEPSRGQVDHLLLSRSRHCLARCLVRTAVILLRVRRHLVQLQRHLAQLHLQNLRLRNRSQRSLVSQVQVCDHASVVNTDIMRVAKDCFMPAITTVLRC